MVMAPLNVQILPEPSRHLHPRNCNNENGIKSRKSSTTGTGGRRRQQNRSPKKFLVFPVDEVQPGRGEGGGGGGGIAKGEGRLVFGKMANWHLNEEEVEEKEGRRKEKMKRSPEEKEMNQKEDEDKEEGNNKRMKERKEEEKLIMEELGMEKKRLDKKEEEKSKEDDEKEIKRTRMDEEEEMNQKKEPKPMNIEEKKMAEEKEEFTEEFGMEESRLKPENGQMIIISTMNNNMNTTTMNGATIKRKIMNELLEKEQADDQQQQLINSSKKSTEVKVSMVKPMNKNKKQFLDVPRIVKAKWTTGPMPIRAKVILLGEAGVGKTSLVYSLKYGCTRLLQCNSTIGAHQNTFDMTGLGNIPVQMQLWDTAGQERFRSMVPIYLRNVNAALLVYDISNRRSFDELDFWHREILRCSASDARAPLLMLIGNKKDQEEEGKREVTEAEGRQKAISFDAPFFEVTSINTSGIRNIFDLLADQLADCFSPKFDLAEEVDEQMDGADEIEEGCKKTPIIRLDGGGQMLIRELAGFWKRGSGGWAALAAGGSGCCGGGGA